MEEQKAKERARREASSNNSNAGTTYNGSRRLKLEEETFEMHLS
jgi:hypothetical protein